MNRTGSNVLCDRRVTEKAKSPLVSYDVQLNLALANDMFFISIGEVQTSVARLLEMMTLAHHDAAPYFDRYPLAFIAASGSIMPGKIRRSCQDTSKVQAYPPGNQLLE